MKWKTSNIFVTNTRSRPFCSCKMEFPVLQWTTLVERWSAAERQETQQNKKGTYDGKGHASRNDFWRNWNNWAIVVLQEKSNAFLTRMTR